MKHDTKRVRRRKRYQDLILREKEEDSKKQHKHWWKNWVDQSQEAIFHSTPILTCSSCLSKNKSINGKQTDRITLKTCFRHDPRKQSPLLRPEWELVRFVPCNLVYWKQKNPLEGDDSFSPSSGCFEFTDDLGVPLFIKQFGLARSLMRDQFMVSLTVGEVNRLGLRVVPGLDCKTNPSHVELLAPYDATDEQINSIILQLAELSRVHSPLKNRRFCKSQDSEEEEESEMYSEDNGEDNDNNYEKEKENDDDDDDDFARQLDVDDDSRDEHIQEFDSEDDIF